MTLTDSDIRRIAAQLGRDQEARIDAKIEAALRRKNGVPPGTYASFQWDGSKIVGAGARGASRLFDTSGAAPTLNSGTTYEYTFSREQTFDYSTPADTWFDTNTPPRIIMPFAGTILTIVQPFWVTDNTTGERLLEIDHGRIGVGGGWDSYTWAWPSLKTGGFLSEYPNLVQRWDVQVGDEFRFYVAHNGGVNTLKCRLDAWFQPI